MSSMTGAVVTVGNRIYTVDEHGHLDPMDQWDEAFAEGMAETLGIHGGLTVDHWRFIRYLRTRFAEEQTVPVLVVACTETDLLLRTFRNLFPTGYFRGACKLAGVNPSAIRTHWLTTESAPVLAAEYSLTALGFLQNIDEWDERFAELVARDWKLPEGLTDRHRRVILFLRELYAQEKRVPTLFETCKANDLGLKEFGELFPEGYRRGACRAAGLPFPD